MKKHNLPHPHWALLASVFIAGTAYAQSIVLSGDSTPVGNLGASYSISSITIGNTGNGTLDLRDSAWLRATGQTYLGLVAGSSGNANMSGASQWSARVLAVGEAGTGTVTVSEGSTLTSEIAHIGDRAGSSGTVTVDGSQSSWTVTANVISRLSIGNNGGSGTLRVRNGAKVTSTHNFVTAQNSPDSTALIESDGIDSRITASVCRLGVSGTSTTQITNGAALVCTSSSELANGSVSLSGTGSLWSGGRVLYIGREDPNGAASVRIGEGSTVQASQLVEVASPFSEPDSTASGRIIIDGTNRPGMLDAPVLRFGTNGFGALDFSHRDASGNYLFPVAMTSRGPGTVNITNGGITALTGNNSYSGITNVIAGVLRAGSATGLSPDSDFVVASGGTLDIATYSPNINSLANAGVVTMLAGGTTGVLTVSNHYVGNGGSIALNTELGDSSSPTERLVVRGDTSGNTVLNITNLGGSGAPTTGNGILVVEVAGTSNGTFSLPAPGYLQAGETRYDLVKIGNNWYLTSEARSEVTGPEISVVCNPSELTAPSQVATCTVALSGASATDLGVNLNLPASNPRYTTTCTSPLVVPANATQASCTITSVGSGAEATASLSIAAPSTPDAYSVGGAPQQVLIKDSNGGGEDNGGEEGGRGEDGNGTAVPLKVPTLGTLGLVAMASVMGLLGLRRSRTSA